MHARLFRLSVLWLTVAVLFIAAGERAVGQPPAAPLPTNVTIQFRVFDAFNPGREFTPADEGQIILRNREGLRNEELTVRITPVPPVPGQKKETLYQITVLRGKVIDELLIPIAGVQTNPAILTKLVTVQDMTLYPGASVSNGKRQFKFA